MFPHDELCMQNVASVTFIPFLKSHNFKFTTQTPNNLVTMLKDIDTTELCNYEEF